MFDRMGGGDGGLSDGGKREPPEQWGDGPIGQPVDCEYRVVSGRSLERALHLCLICEGEKGDSRKEACEASTRK